MKTTIAPKQIKLGQAEDLTNKKFGLLTPLYRCEKPRDAKSRGAYWYCHCDCNNYTIVRADGLKRGTVISCGCEGIKRRSSAIKKDLTNQRFGELIALYPTDKRENNSRKCIMWHCICDCGNEIDVPTSALTTKNTQSCGHHKQSKGARFIEQFLKDNNINYKKEKTFKDCKDKGLLRFDFYLPDYNCCIEYDGEQHFLEASSGFFKDRLNDIQKKDAIKNKYCRQKGILLLRYTKENVKNLSINDLMKELNE